MENNIPTAEEILDILIPIKNNVSDEENEASLLQNKETLIGWCKLHCQAQARVIAETIGNEYDFDGEFKSKVNPKGIVNRKVKDSILNAYPLDNIK